ncbi:hypothetical protein MmiAt1_00080 [Methanimicrococcus sp. At1]|uniref:Transmembrane protein n=1 Tax=Methanimicrococcus hacksteinii TaxID=3028293 RepID=A0ABU3VM33_9EURY|nr:hypothetical protein [Methanimicrococcus sp. At1]
MISIKTKNRLFCSALLHLCMLPLFYLCVLLLYLCVLPLLSAQRDAFPCASSHSYHIRSLRERGHRLPYCFRLHSYLTVSVCCRYLIVCVCTDYLADSVNTVADLPACQLPPPLCRARTAQFLKQIQNYPIPRFRIVFKIILSHDFESYSKPSLDFESNSKNGHFRLLILFTIRSFFLIAASAAVSIPFFISSKSGGVFSPMTFFSGV